ncbi:MAG: ribonuclease Z [Candidatus Aenigmarchaeota archaeon]|nr:ribonuclease Z [Candidatus Aenigmarchaeota archaeon]
MTKIEVTILGTTAGIPTKERAHPAIYLSYQYRNEFCYLFDCGEGTQRQILLADLNPMKLDGIFITHWHGDHYIGLPMLVESMGLENRTKPLDIYAPGAKRVENLIDLYYYSSKGFEIILKDVPAEDGEITNLLETNDFRIVSTPVEHGLPAVAYGLLERDKVNIDLEKAQQKGLPDRGLIYKEIKEKGKALFEDREIKLEDIARVEKGKKFVYSGDTQICDNLIKLAQQADLLIQDCTYFEESDKSEEYGHASLNQVIEMVYKTKVKTTVLTHISRKYRDPEELKERIKDYPNFKIAEDFMRIVI